LVDQVPGVCVDEVRFGGELLMLMRKVDSTRPMFDMLSSVTTWK
jgi:hypothetical protein